MIATLSGILRSKSPTEVLLDVHGVGYAVHIPLSTYAAVGEVGSSVTLLTHLQVRDDAMVLFGFASENEREMFRMLLGVTGIGPKLAQNILSGIAASDLRGLIQSGNASALTAIPGIGKKTAERIILDLRDKVSGGADSDSDIGVAGRTPMNIRTEALQAMLALGFPRPAAEKAIRSALQGAGDATLAVEDLLKRSLKLAGTR
ncbi:MAG: Holliday junction branch migration protein RuvA [Bacteroidota bacterium]